eukprot:CAMPEP_0178985764 /NCGR_PEP_ID=MMETSP0795-20121207/2329_1 /TAXON_ID=88552 /ORGANISM="Amoebophrya sp., Strain Ameob2" /LENGTH=150 /DNA_ID=CAMNT_0020676749 /DNA_START=28 /DNA_END=480 /DNA_ORIENTATION=+
MGKFLKAGRIVILTSGRMAGKKAVCVKTFDEGSKTRAFPHCLVAGIQKAPLKITQSMSKKKQQKRLRVKPFVKYVNYTHVMPTRYSIPGEMEAKTMVSDTQMDAPDGRIEAKKALCGLFKEKFQNPTTSVSDKSGSGKAALLFLKKKLRF